MAKRPQLHKLPGRTTRAQYDAERNVTNAAIYNNEWRKLRNWFIQHQPLCVECLKHDITEPASHVDHIVPVKIAPERRLDITNLQSLCVSCHSQKTARENSTYKY